ncbi:hypothetical protein FZEAL_10572 [Fusarium zealandicum]|uniref:Uncharacterized protein n=1 Tax=Fusarium zealandicum TaxID=1053134 RepID=A0A8H4TZT8_9HYPO|nr:hypothetical protein FZEAL_10572 [Fusarium zealandicum]
MPSSSHPPGPVTPSPRRQASRRIFGIRPISYRIDKRSSRTSAHSRSQSLPELLDLITMPSPTTAMGPLPPSDEEARLYYYGLGNEPRLVARSSTEPWAFVGQSRWPLAKSLDPVGKHAVVTLWNSAGPLRQEIIEALDGVSWSAVDILRLGYLPTGDEAESPVTLFISVEAGSTPWVRGHSVVTRCREILQRHKIHDVHVEMKESRLIQSASTPSQLVSDPLAYPIELTSLLSEFLGVSIAPLSALRHEGTKGLYLRCRQTGTVFVLTCRHVVFDSNINQDYRHASATPQSVVQPGDTTLEKLKHDFVSELDVIETVLQSRQGDPRPSTQSVVKENLDDKNTCISIIQTLDDLLQNPATRILGHVAFSPKLSLGKAESGAGRMRDWALIELHPGRHQTQLDALENKAFVGTGNRRIANAAMEAETRPCDRGSAKRKVALEFQPATCTVLVKGATPITEHELKHPSIDLVSLDEPSTIVAKAGRSTCLTFGVTNEVKSITRKPIIGETKYLSEELCILGHKQNGAGRAPFSEGGDSGSCVFDLRGCVCAMMTGGLGTGNGALDTTYATPIEWLLDDIRQHGYDVEIV